MREIIQKYFSDPATDATYADKNVFNPPTDIKTINRVEKDLNINFPEDYKDFLLITNGYDGTLGQSYVRFIKVEEISKFTDMYGGDFFPWVIYLGSDGGNEMFVLDKRGSELQFGVMPFIGEDKDFISLGKTFEEFVGHLYNNDYWESEVK
ncbi:MAG: SMI1/KNR4 family protein [Nitrososphaerales archaeon]